MAKVGDSPFPGLPTSVLAPVLARAGNADARLVCKAWRALMEEELRPGSHLYIPFMSALHGRALDVHLILVIAAESGRARLVAALLAGGADVHVGDDLPLWSASFQGHAEVVDVLLAAGADARAYQNASLISAVRRGHTACVEALLRAGADARSNDDEVLISAAFMGHTGVVKALLAGGADARARTHGALISAANRGFTACVEALLLPLLPLVDVRDRKAADNALRLSTLLGNTATAQALNSLLHEGSDLPSPLAKDPAAASRVKSFAE